MSIKVTGSALDGSVFTLENPTSMIVTRAYDTPAEMVEITFPIEATVPDLINITVDYNGGPIFTGTCDEILRTLDSDGSFVTINARSPGAQLVDNEQEPVKYISLTADYYFENKLKPYGFTSLTVSGTVQPAETFQINKGHSLWEVFTQLCFRLYGREPYVGRGRRIYVGKLSTESPIYINNDPSVSALRYCDLQYITRRSSSISKIRYADSQGDYTLSMVNPFGNAQGVQRERFVIPGVEFDDVPSMDAFQRMIRGELGLHSLHATLPGLYDMYPGESVYIKSIPTGEKLLAVYQSKIIFNYTGCRTRLILSDPAYM